LQYIIIDKEFPANHLQTDDSLCLRYASLLVTTQTRNKLYKNYSKYIFISDSTVIRGTVIRDSVKSGKI